MRTPYRLCQECRKPFKISNFHSKMLKRNIISMIFCPSCGSPLIKKISNREYFQLMEVNL